jgi:hypothetical protein
MKFKSLFPLVAMLLCICLLSGCKETEAERALRKLKRAMNEVVSVADELDMLNESDLDIERYQDAISLETGSFGDSTGSLPKPVESFLGVIAQAEDAHQTINDIRIELQSISVRIQMLINKIRNDDDLSLEVDLESVNATAGLLYYYAESLTATIGTVVRVFNSQIQPDLGSIVANIDSLLSTFENILSSLNNRVCALEGVLASLTAVEQHFIELVSRK